MFENLLVALDILWKGMLGIFAVIVVITLIVIFIQWFEQRINNKSSDKE